MAQFFLPHSVCIKDTNNKIISYTKINCFLTCNNQFCFRLKESQKFNVHLVVPFLLNHPVYIERLLVAELQE